MTAERFRYDTGCFIDMQENKVLSEIQATNLLNKLVKENEQLKKELDKLKLVNEMLSMDFANSEHELWRENEQLKSFIDDLTTKGTGRIDLANGYSYSVSAVLTNWKGDVE